MIEFFVCYKLFKLIWYWYDIEYDIDMMQTINKYIEWAIYFSTIIIVKVVLQVHLTNAIVL